MKIDEILILSNKKLYTNIIIYINVNILLKLIK